MMEPHEIELLAKVIKERDEAKKQLRMQPADLEFLTGIIEKQGNLEKEIRYLEIERKHWRDECEKARMKLDIAVKALENIASGNEGALHAAFVLEEIRDKK